MFLCYCLHVSLTLAVKLFAKNEIVTGYRESMNSNVSTIGGRHDCFGVVQTSVEKLLVAIEMYRIEKEKVIGG